MSGKAPGIGRRYRISLRSGDWKAFFIHTRKRAILRDIEGLGGGAVRAGGEGVDIWNPANPRGEAVPNMVFECQDDGIMVLDLGGHSGALTTKLNELIAAWQSRYVGYEMCLVVEDGKIADTHLFKQDE